MAGEVADRIYYIYIYIYCTGIYDNTSFLSQCINSFKTYIYIYIHMLYTNRVCFLGRHVPVQVRVSGSSFIQP